MLRIVNLLVVTTVLILPGCAREKEKDKTPKAPGDEANVSELFKAFQAAIKAKDADKTWALLDLESQGDAERIAKETSDDYANAAAQDKADHEKKFGLTAADFAKLNGVRYLKTDRFIGKYDEVPDSTLKSVSVQGDAATITYVEEDGDEEKLKAVRQDGQWRLRLTIPK